MTEILRDVIAETYTTVDELRQRDQPSSLPISAAARNLHVANDVDTSPTNLEHNLRGLANKGSMTPSCYGVCMYKMCGYAVCAPLARHQRGARVIRIINAMCLLHGCLANYLSRSSLLQYIVHKCK